MNQRFFFFRVAAVTVSLFGITMLSACQFMHNLTEPTLNGNGVIRTQTRSVDVFERVIIPSLPFDVEVICSEQIAPKIEMTGDENLLSLLSEMVKRNTLHLSFNTTSSARKVNPTERIKLRIYAPLTLKQIESHGNHRIDIRNVNAKTFWVSGNHDTRITISGKADSAVIRGIGPKMEFLADNFQVQHSTTQLRSDAFAVVRAEQSLYATVHDGYVEYYGNPKTLFTSILGTGNIVQKR